MNRIKARSLIVVIVIAALLPAIIWGEPRIVDGQTGGDYWRNIIFDFQTLFGGILAVFAAWWTVGTMEATDRSAALRHREVVEWNLISDRRKLTRAVYPQVDVLKRVLENVHAVAELERNRDTNDRDYWDKWATKAIEIHRDVFDVLRRPHFVSGGDLFDGELTHNVWTLTKAAEKVAKDVATAAFYANREFDSADDYYEFGVWNSDGGSSNIREFLRTTSDHLPQIITMLEEHMEFFQRASKTGFEVSGVNKLL